jgi:excisionase family DNA binding protein
MQNADHEPIETTIPALLDDEQVAYLLGCSLRFVRRLADERRIAYQLIARRRRYRPEDVRAYLDAERRPSIDPQERMAEPPRRHRGGRPKRSELGAA